jgi:hypothetical protein
MAALGTPRRRAPPGSKGGKGRGAGQREERKPEWLCDSEPPPVSTRTREAREDLLEGHEVFRVFDRGMRALAEPLRAMRIVPSCSIAGVPRAELLLE